MSSAVYGILLQICFACQDELVVPFLTEPVDERLFQELIQPDPFLPAEYLSRAAYLPAVIIYSCECRVLSQAQRIKSA